MIVANGGVILRISGSVASPQGLMETKRRESRGVEPKITISAYLSASTAPMLFGSLVFLDAVVDGIQGGLTVLESGFGPGAVIGAELRDFHLRDAALGQ
jgi:hypothetical protein